MQDYFFNADKSDNITIQIHIEKYHSLRRASCVTQTIFQAALSGFLQYIYL